MPRTPARAESTELKPQWQRILYRWQPYPDNYVDPSFLSGLRRNHYLKIYSLVIAETSLIFLTTFLALIGFMMRLYRDSSFGATAFYSSLKELALLLGALLALSPVLMTLTETIADDTAWASAILLLLLHLYTFDYDADIFHAPRLIAPISLNAATFAAVLLSSRLRTPLHAYGLISFAVEIFALYPIVRMNTRKSAGRTQEDPKLALFMVALLTPLLFILSPYLLALFLCVIVVVNFLLPALFVHLQRHKNVINGPWDEAVPDTIHDSLE